ncbi:MAG: hypothetical protein EOO99_06205 [Pedobacter sp.]|nr:MAG: hypothetical protein EOO99_06205 [Pedobacter sp.]
MKVMISGGQQLAALKLKNKLSAQFEVILADFGDIPQTGLSNNPILGLGAWNPTILAHHILKVCLDLGITMYIPLNFEEWIILDKARLLFAEYHIQLGFPVKEKEIMLFKSSQFQDFVLFDNGELIFSSSHTKHLNFPFSLVGYSGLIGIHWDLGSSNSSSDVANFSFITI